MRNPNPRRNDDGGNMDEGGGERRKSYPRRKVCRFCVDKSLVNYKDVRTLCYYISEHGKILPRRMTGTCAKHQRILAREIKKARIMALLPYGPPHI